MWRGAYGTYILYGCGASPYTAVPAFFFGTGFTLGSSIGSVLSDSAAIYYDWRAGPDD